MRRLIAVIVLLAALLGACQPTGIPACDRNVAALAVAAAEGYRYDCTPTEVELPANKDGWADHASRTLWVRPDTILDFTTWVMWHELGHAVWENRGYVASQATEEWWVAGWSWCHWPLAGFSYAQRPADCAPYWV